MIGQYLISFREVLEAALIIAIILAYLSRTDRRRLFRFVWYGVCSSVAASMAVGVSVWLAYGALSKSTQVLFEGLTAYLAVFVLSYMVFWMATKGREIKKEIERRVKAMAARRAIFGLAAFSFVVVFREGLETVLFLTNTLVTDPFGTIVGGTLGAITAFVLTYAIFIVGKSIDMRRFFYFTGILLLLLAGGLAGYGTHELIEYNELEGKNLGWLQDPAYDLGIPANSPFHHKGAIGSVFAVMFGYTVVAEWARVIVQATYLIIAIPTLIRVYSPRRFHSLVSRIFRRSG